MRISPFLSQLQAQNSPVAPHRYSSLGLRESYNNTSGRDGELLRAANTRAGVLVHVDVLEMLVKTHVEECPVPLVESGDEKRA